MSDTPKRKMSNKDIQDMAERCIEEISMLRTQISHLRPKAEAYEAITQILSLLPYKSEGMGEDILWHLKDQVRQLKETLDG